MWKEKVDQNWDHENKTDIFWNTLHQLQNKKPSKNQIEQ